MDSKKTLYFLNNFGLINFIVNPNKDNKVAIKISIFRINKKKLKFATMTIKVNKIKQAVTYFHFIALGYFSTKINRQLNPSNPTAKVQTAVPLP